MGGSSPRSKKTNGKMVPKIKFCIYTYFALACITLLKAVSHYDLSGLSMSVMGFPKNICGWGALYSDFYFWIFLTLQNLLMNGFLVLTFVKLVDVCRVLWRWHEGGSIHGKLHNRKQWETFEEFPLVKIKNCTCYTLLIGNIFDIIVNPNRVI